MAQASAVCAKCDWAHQANARRRDCCPVRALAEGTLPPGSTVKRRRLVRLGGDSGEQPVSVGARARSGQGTSGKSGKPGKAARPGKKDESEKKQPWKPDAVPVAARAPVTPCGWAEPRTRVSDVRRVAG